MKKMKAIASLCAALLCAALPATISTPASAATTSYNIVALGDSITAGYGLQNGEASYVDHIAQITKQPVQNFAVSGLKTEGLLSQLNGSAEIQGAVQNADLILVTIAANDVLSPVVHNDIFDFTAYHSMAEMTAAFTPQIRVKMLSYLAQNMPGIVEKANANVNQIIDTLKAQNPSAKLVFQTVYDPLSFKADDTGLSQDVMSAVAFLSDGQIYQYLEGSLNGSTFIETGINENIRNHGEVTVIDAYNFFHDHAWMCTGMSHMDIHPNPFGHEILAEEILYTDLFAPGNFAYSRGDVDNNNVVSVEDAVQALTEYANTSAGNASAFSLYEFANADMNRDGAVTVEDAVSILERYAKISAGLDVAE